MDIPDIPLQAAEPIEKDDFDTFSLGSDTDERADDQYQVLPTHFISVSIKTMHMILSY
jgi:hypothetical protein